MQSRYTSDNTNKEGSAVRPRAARPERLLNLTSSALRIALRDPISRDGKELYEIPICVTGTWVKYGRSFSISESDFKAMVRNFEKRRNEQVVIDYEHASEQPEVARGGPVIAAGWIHQLSVARGPSCLATEHGREAADGNEYSGELDALVEWTPQAIEMIGTGQYRFFSPAIDWTCCDKGTGEPQGATLTSGALTNHPFLEELPAISLSDLDREGISGTNPSDSQFPAPPGHVPSATGKGEQENDMKKLTIKPLTEGQLKGHHAIFDNDDVLGYLDADEFADYAKKCGDLESVAMTEALQDLGFGTGDSGSTREQIVKQLKFAAEASARDLEMAGRKLLLNEAVRDGTLDNHKAAQLARDGRITLADYVAAQEADKRLDEAVRTGKILPRQRKFFFHDAIARSQEFAEYVKQAVPAVRLGTEGIGTVADISVDDEIKLRTQRLMVEERVTFAKALKKVLAADQELERRYHGSHRKEIGSDPAFTGESDEARGITA